MSERIDGIKYTNSELENQETLEALRERLLEQHRRITVEIERIDYRLLALTQDQLMFDTGDRNRERLVGRALISGEVEIEEAFEALGE